MIIHYNRLFSLNSSRKKGCEPNIHSILPSKSDSKMVSSGGKANSSLVVVISSKPRRQTSRITVSCSSDLIILQNMALSSLYNRVVVIRAPLQGLCATLKGMLWIGWLLLPQDGFRKVPTTAPYHFVDQLNTARRFMWNKATKVRRTVDAASHIYRWRDLLW